MNFFLSLGMTMYNRFMALLCFSTEHLAGYSWCMKITFLDSLLLMHENYPSLYKTCSIRSEHGGGSEEISTFLSTLEVYGDVVKPLHGTTSHHFFFCSEEGKKRKNISEVCQQVSASPSQPEPYCKTSSVPRPSPFIMVGWPWEEGTWQISILLGEGRPAGETPQTGRKGGNITSLWKFLYVYRILSGEPHTRSSEDSRQPKTQSKFQAQCNARSPLPRCCHGWWGCSQPCHRSCPWRGTDQPWKGSSYPKVSAGWKAEERRIRIKWLLLIKAVLN